jgi:hypothetical protein
MVSSSVIGGSKFSYELFGCKLRFCLEREVIWRHDAKHRVASDSIFGPRLGENSRAPAMIASAIYQRSIFECRRAGLVSPESPSQCDYAWTL